MDLYQQPLLPLFTCKKYKVKSLKTVSICLENAPFWGYESEVMSIIV